MFVIRGSLKIIIYYLITFLYINIELRFYNYYFINFILKIDIRKHFRFIFSIL